MTVFVMASWREDKRARAEEQRARAGSADHAAQSR
jgi:hypothetical protein